MDTILVIGACGQIGTELTAALRQRYGRDRVIAADIQDRPAIAADGPYIKVNVLDKPMLQAMTLQLNITKIYQLAAMLSATGEKYPSKAWELNIQGLINVLDIAKTGGQQIFWPSSIAVFGNDAPKEVCPQRAPTLPATVYGISKVAGELWCQYYHEQYGIDVRSLRYPGLISHTAPPGGGTTDYAVDIFHQAVRHNTYTCFLKPKTRLPMMYMPDAIKATLALMDAPKELIKIRTSYNIAAMSFAPEELSAAIAKHLAGFTMTCQPDQRQAIADSWPGSIDDRQARTDWHWRFEYDLEAMTADMLRHLKK